MMAESPFDDDISEMKETDGTSLEAAERYASKRQRWEENVIKRILSLAGQAQMARELIRRHHDRTNEYKLTFSEFKREFHAKFPIWLGFEKVPFTRLQKVGKQLAEMRKADRNVLVDLFFEHTQSLDPSFQDCRRGVVFEWLHHGSPYKIIHNHPCTLVYPWTRTSITVPDHETLHIEDLDGYLHSIGWANDIPKPGAS